MDVLVQIKPGKCQGVKWDHSWIKLVPGCESNENVLKTKDTPVNAAPSTTVPDQVGP